MSAGRRHPTRRPGGWDENVHAHDAAAFDGASLAFRRVLWPVIAVNAVTFVVEMAAGTEAERRRSTPTRTTSRATARPAL